MIRTAYPMLVTAVAAGVFNLAVATDALAMEPPARQLTYEVDRDGKPIGQHEFLFSSAADGRLMVDIKTDIAVKVMFLTVYHFKHQGHEEWTGNRLTEMRSVTDDDGTDHKLLVTATGKNLDVKADGSEHEAPGDLITASLWNPALVSRGRLLNTLTGEVMNVSINDAGMSSVTTPDGDVPARHYRITGDLEREVWFDAKGRLVAMAFAGKDGSSVTYRLTGYTP